MLSGAIFTKAEYCSLASTSPAIYNSVIVPHFALASSITVILYCKIALTAYQQSRKINVQAFNNSQNVPGSITEMKITKMMGLVIGTYFALYLPGLFTGFLLKTLRTGTDILLIHIALILFHANTRVNPIIYGFKNVNIKKAYINTLKCSKSYNCS